ncbi:MAG: hypothetical protein RR945_00410 [Erysipelotrichaceae bacterium]
MKNKKMRKIEEQFLSKNPQEKFDYCCELANRKNPNDITKGLFQLCMKFLIAVLVEYSKRVKFLNNQIKDIEVRNFQEGKVWKINE